jgi:prephenate dehydrogenase
MKLADTQVAIIGIGLMGGSLARALQGKVASLTGVDSDQNALDHARGLGIFDRLSPEPTEGLEPCDLAILAAPVRAILDLIDRINQDLPTPRYLMDLGSTKETIAARMQSLPDQVDPVGGHPLCGMETAGIQASDPEIFQGSVFVLTPLARTSDGCLRLAEELVTAVGAMPMIMSAEEHDRLAAITSHLPYLLTAALTGTAMNVELTDQRLVDMIASGFIDTTRIAASDVEMISDVLLSNSSNIVQVLHHFSENAQTLAGLVEKGNIDALHEHLMPIQRWRRELPKYGSEEA